MWKFLKDQVCFNTDDNAGTGAGSQDGGIAGAAAEMRAAGGEGASAAQAGAGDGTAKPPAGTPDKTNQGAAGEQFEIVWNGQKVNMTRQELIDNAQRAYNVTQGEQANSKTRKELAAAYKRLEELMADAEKQRGKPPENDDDDPVTTLSKANIATRKEVAELREKALLQDWERAVTPVMQKYPDISEKALLDEFQEQVKAGEVDDNAAGLMKTAEGMANKHEDLVGKRLDALLAKEDDPRMKALKEKWIAGYVADKTKNANAGGEKGAGAAGSGADKVKSISETAAELRSAV
jgi:hypothetical protein